MRGGTVIGDRYAPDLAVAIGCNRHLQGGGEPAVAARDPSLARGKSDFVVIRFDAQGLVAGRPLSPLAASRKNT